MAKDTNGGSVAGSASGGTSGRTLAKGMAITLLGASLWGFSGCCIQFLQTRYQIDPMFLATIRMLLGGLVFLVPICVSHRKELVAIFHEPGTLVRIAFFGTAGLLLCQLTYIFTISFTNAGTATVLQMLNIVFILAGACVIARRAPRAMEVLGVLLALVATVLIATGGDLGTLNIPIPGLIWGIVSAATVTLYVMYPRKLFMRWGSLTVTGLGMVAGGIAALAIVTVFQLVFNATGGAAGYAVQIPELGMDGILALAAVILLGTCGAFGLYLHGVSIVGGVRGSLLGAAEPVCATVVSTIWLGTAFGWADWTGLVLMIATTFVVTLMGDKV